MPLYESTFIARHDMSTQQVEGLAESFTTIIKENGGEVTKTESWGLKTLAYRIKKNRKGHYVFFNLDAPSAAVHEFERNLRLNEDILRYLTVRVDELDPEPSAMMQARASRDDRSRRGGGRPRDGESQGDRPKAAEKDSADDKPKTTAAETAAGSDSAKPDDTAKPDAAAVSEASAKPDAAAVSEDGAKPDDTAKPDDAAVSEASAKPDDTAKPDAAAVSEDSAKPDAAAVSEDGAKPDDTVSESDTAAEKSADDAGQSGDDK